MKKTIATYLKKCLTVIALISFAAGINGLFIPADSITTNHLFNAIVFLFISFLSIYSIILWKKFNNCSQTMYQLILRFKESYDGKVKVIDFEAKTDKEALEKVESIVKEQEVIAKYASNDAHFRGVYILRIDKIISQEVRKEIFLK